MAKLCRRTCGDTGLARPALRAASSTARWTTFSSSRNVSFFPTFGETLFMKSILLLITALITLPPPARAANCDSPRDDTDVSACIEAELRQSDEKINQRYQQLMGKLSEPDKRELRADQRTWIKQRDSSCGSSSKESSRESWFQSLLKDYRKTVCIVRFTRTRVTYLENRLAAQSSPKSTLPYAAAENEDQYELRAKHGHSRGKWYFEVKLAGGEIAKKAETALQMGFSTQGLTVGRILNLRKRDSGVPTVRLGFALDLDNGKYYAHTNGIWRNGSPGSAEGIDIKLGREYRAVISSSTSLSEIVKEGLLNANFGQSPFDYAMPAGYRPVAER